LAVPGAATKRTCTPSRLCTLLRMITYSAVSIANAMRVRSAAMKARNVASMASVTCEESENRRAIKAVPVAAGDDAQRSLPRSGRDENGIGNVPTGCTARPRVTPAPIVAFLKVD
jgi:hypothetical protein